MSNKSAISFGGPIPPPLVSFAEKGQRSEKRGEKGTSLPWKKVWRNPAP